MKQCLLSLRSYLYKVIVEKENMEIIKYIKKPDKKLNRQTKIKKVSYCCGNDNGSYSKVIFRKSSNIGKGFFSATAVNLQKSYFVRAPNR